MKSIRALYYKSESLKRQWKIERTPIEAMVRAITKAIATRGLEFVPNPALSIGSTGILLKVKDSGLGTVRLLKLPRPRGGTFGTNTGFLERESKKLASLAHAQIVAVQTSGTTILTTSKQKGTDVHWYVMNFVEGAEKKITSSWFIDDILGLHEGSPFDPSVVSSAYKVLTTIFLDIARALSYLHRKNIVHFDVKPDNILIVKDRSGWRGFLSDLGYSNYKDETGRSSAKLPVRFTYYFAPPHLRKLAEEQWVGMSSPDAVRVLLPPNEITEDVDMFMFGFTMLEVRKAVINRLSSHMLFGPHELFDDKYLRLVAGRLIGKDLEECVDRLELAKSGLYPKSQLYSGLENKAAPWGQLHYKSMDDAVRDLEKALDQVGIEQFAPELNAAYPGIVQVAGTAKPPFTDRIKRLLNTTVLSRLASISQLGLLRTVYPGANHTRLEHSLGTYANICEYVRALYNNRRDPFFRSILTNETAPSLILAALLHDVGYYPLAHDLDAEERWARLNGSTKLQEHYTRRIVTEDDDLKDVIKEDWRPATVAQVAEIIAPKSQRLVNNLLHSMIDGPIDADKMDYLFRDSIHIGLGYGLGMDTDWFLRNLAVVFVTSSTPELGVTQKGRISAESVASIRNELYERAYWHHTARAMKAMVAFAVSRMQSVRPNEHYEFFRNLMKTQVRLNRYFNPGDVAQLRWLRARTSLEGRRVLDMLLDRRLFKRVCLITPQEDLFTSYIGKVQNWQVRENLRLALQTKIAKELGFVSYSKPLVLLDLPLSAPLGELYTISGEGETAGPIQSDIWRIYNEGFEKTLRNLWIFAHPDSDEEIIEHFGPIQTSALKSEMRQLLIDDAQLGQR